MRSLNPFAYYAKPRNPAFEENGVPVDREIAERHLTRLGGGMPPLSDRTAWVARGYEDPATREPQPDDGDMVGVEDLPPQILKLAGFSEQEIAAAREPTPKSIVGDLVGKFDRYLQAFLTRRADLERKIADDTETLRQVNASIDATMAALLTVAEDPALTDAERETADGAVAAIIDPKLLEDEDDAVE